jgi:hypothetical protein
VKNLGISARPSFALETSTVATSRKRRAGTWK